MESNKRTIRIESILGGQSPSSHFSREDQFLGSVAIDPSFSFNSTTPFVKTSGLLVPSPSNNISGETVTNSPLWIVQQPKSRTYFIYDAGGSIYTADTTSVTGLGDLNDAGSATGNGCAYYDNYMYFATDSTIARYGPLDGTPTFTDSYWVTTLSKTALTNTSYPYNGATNNYYPNHVLHRHSDGKLYIADVVGNQGTIHYIATTKTSVEGDTDNGSTFGKLTLGYGLWPTAIESYGSDLVIALYEGVYGSGDPVRIRAKLAFWDTTSQNVNKITWVEFPDSIITALQNVNGVLYVLSGNHTNGGYRVSRFVGGYTVEEVGYFEQGVPSLAGAVDASGNRLFFGSNGSIDQNNSADGVVWSLGTAKASLGNGLFNVMRSTSSTASTQNAAMVTALSFLNTELTRPTLISGWSTGASGGSRNGIDVSGGSNNQTPSVWVSQIYKIGQPFKITKLRIPLGQAVGSGMIVTPKIYTDNAEGSTYTGGTTNGLSVINNSNYSGQNTVVMRPENVTGKQNFFLEFRWTGTSSCVVALPITIEYELLDD